MLKFISYHIPKNISNVKGFEEKIYFLELHSDNVVGLHPEGTKKTKLNKAITLTVR